jgi:sn-glycerol 3-phosphate transport system substrate-binding protein
MQHLSRRQVLAGLFGATSLALLNACQSAAPAAPTSGAPAAVKSTGSSIAITYWGAFGGHNADVQQQLVDKFNQDQKDIRLTLENQNTYQDLAAKLTAAVQARSTPDVVLLSDVWWFKFYLNKVLQPLDDLMKAESVNASDYVDVFYKETVRAGKQVVLPFARSTPIFYYNKDIWSKAGLPDRGPKTWDEFVGDFVPKLKGQAPTIFGIGGAASYSAWVFQGVIWQHGGAYSDPDFTIRIQEPNGIKAGELWRAAVRDGWATPSKDPGTDFNSGAIIAYLDSTAGLAGHESAAKFAVGTAFLPEGPAGFGCCTGGSGMSIVAASPREKQQAAMKWLAYATGTQTTFWSQNTGYMPVRNAAVSSSEMQAFYKDHPNFKTTLDQLPKTRPQDSARELIPNGDEIIGKGLERISTNQEPAELVFKDIADQLNNEKQPVLRSLKDLGES